MKKEEIIKTLILSIALIIISIILSLAFGKTSLENTINVQGTATISVIPDLIGIYFNVETSGETATEAKNANSEIVEKMKDNLLELGLKEEEIFTENFNVYPDYEWKNGERKENGYKATHSIKVEILVEESEKIGFKLKVGNHVNLGPDPLGIFFGYMKTGDKILKRFYIRHKEKINPLEKELVFGRKKEDVIKIGDHEVTGVFDRIDKLKNKWYITDYKTNKYSPETDSFTLHRNIQFSLYSHAFRQIFGEKEAAILFYHLRSGKVFKTFRNQKDYDYLKRILDEVSEGITKNKFVPFYGFHCNMCDKKSACEKYSIPHHGGPRINLGNQIKGAKEFDLWYDVDADIPYWIESSMEN